MLVATCWAYGIRIILYSCVICTRSPRSCRVCCINVRRRSRAPVSPAVTGGTLLCVVINDLMHFFVASVLVYVLVCALNAARHTCVLRFPISAAAAAASVYYNKVNENLKPFIVALDNSSNRARGIIRWFNPL